MAPSDDTRASRRTSWLVGLVLATIDGVLVLEFPTLGLVVLVVAALLIGRSGRLGAGAAGLATGIGGTWTVLFGRVALECAGGTPTSGSCYAPSIGTAVEASLGILAVGLLTSVIVAVRSRT